MTRSSEKAVPRILEFQENNIKHSQREPERQQSGENVIIATDLAWKSEELREVVIYDRRKSSTR